MRVPSHTGLEGMTLSDNFFIFWRWRGNESITRFVEPSPIFTAACELDKTEASQGARLR